MIVTCVGQDDKTQSTHCSVALGPSWPSSMIPFAWFAWFARPSQPSPISIHISPSFAHCDPLWQEEDDIDGSVTYSRFRVDDVPARQGGTVGNTLRRTLLRQDFGGVGHSLLRQSV